MSDESIAAQIDRLVSEEKDLRQREQQDRQDDQTLEAEFGQDPDDAEARSSGTVENYKQ